MAPARTCPQGESELRKRCLAFLAASLMLAGCASRPPGEQQTEGKVQQVQLTAAQGVSARADAPETTAASAVQRTEASPEDEASSIYFGYGSSKVDLSGREKLRALASKLNKNSDSTVTLVGRADDLGSPSYSLAVAGERVDAVADILRSYGVAKNRISKSVRGNETLTANCSTKACKRRMRRVELRYSAN